MGVEVRDLKPGELEAMMEEHRRLNPDIPVRADIKEALDNYAMHGWPVGSFLTAVLENDLFEAMGRADSYNRATIHQICSYVFSELPSTCWGNRELVRAHYARFKKDKSDDGL